MTQETPKRPTDQVRELRQRLEEMEQTLNAIRNGEVDALMISGEAGDRIYTLEHAERPYRFMIEQMNEGAIMLSSEGIILFSNAAFAAIVKSSTNEVLANPVFRYVSPSSTKIFDRLLRYGGRETVLLLAADDSHVMAEVTLSPVHGDTTINSSMIVNNLTEDIGYQKLAASEKFSRTLLEQSADAVVICDTGGRIIQASEKAYDVFRANIKGLPLNEVFRHFHVMPTLDGFVNPWFDRIRKDEIASGSEVFETLDGHPGRHYILTFTRITEDESVLGYSISLSDITERKNTEQELHRYREHLEELVAARTRELRELAHRLVDAQEKERTIIGNELHDEIGQYLTYTTLLIERACRKYDADLLKEAKTTVQEAIGQIRDLSSLLSPRYLRSAGLLQSVQSMIDDYARRTHIKMAFTHEGLETLPEEVALAGYRIIQEALTNAARHSGATEVTVKLLRHDEGLFISIVDNGLGFDPDTVKHSTGLTGMRERALALAGEFDIVSQNGKGTTITARFPLDRTEELCAPLY